MIEIPRLNVGSNSRLLRAQGLLFGHLKAMIELNLSIMLSKYLPPYNNICAFIYILFTV